MTLFAAIKPAPRTETVHMQMFMALYGRLVRFEEQLIRCLSELRLAQGILVHLNSLRYSSTKVTPDNFDFTALYCTMPYREFDVISRYMTRSLNNLLVKWSLGRIKLSVHAVIVDIDINTSGRALPPERTAFTINIH